MGYNEFDELGDKIQSIIDSAVNEKNYQKLSQSINQALNKAIDNGSDALRDALNNTVGSGKYTNYRSGSSYDYRENRSWDFQKDGKKNRSTGDGHGTGYQGYAGAKGNDSRNGNFQRNGTGRQDTNHQNSDLALYLPTNGIKVKGILKTVFGGILTGVFGILTLIVGGVAILKGGGFWVGAGVLAAITASGGTLLGQGCSSLTSLSRRNKYIKALGTHTYCNFQQLAQAVGKPVKFVKKDIKRMISKGWFLQGHVDKQETCLITSNETFDQYVSTQTQLEEREHQQAEERARQEAALRQQEEEKERQKFNQREQEDARACVEAEREAKERARLSPEVRQVLDKGNDFLDKIHRSNDAIPGEEISRKISRMELIIAKIFERAKAHPEIIPDLNRLMDYYLPMTVKLLNAYEEMDSQPVQGENITSSKKEIEETIDTLNVAFEKLLDSIFEDTAMDVSSDISVLNTVLAQEGLTEDELTRMRKEAEKNRL